MKTELSNPFIAKSRRCRRRFVPVARDTGVVIVDKETGELKDGERVVGEARILDYDTFVKFYRPEKMFELSGCAIKVFCYLLFRLGNNGVAMFDVPDCCEYMQTTCKSSVYKAMKELADKGFVAKKTKGRYWINPNIAYKGYRKNVVPDKDLTRAEIANLNKRDKREIYPPTPDNLNTEQDE